LTRRPPLLIAAVVLTAATAGGQAPLDPDRSAHPLPTPSAPPGLAGPVLVAIEPGPSRPAARWARRLRDDLRLTEVGVSPRAAVRVTGRVVDGALRVELSGADGFSLEFAPDDDRAPHATADALLEALTGRAGVFDSTLVFARPAGRRRKDIFRVRVDGSAPVRVSSGRGVALLPALAHGDVWYSVLDRGSLFVTRAGAGERPVIGGEGLTMGVTACGDGIAFSSNRDGDAEIYRADRDGSNVRRVTFHDGIDVSPACSPLGELAFVSSRGGSPRLHLMPDGALHPVRPPQPDAPLQTPTWCPDPNRRVLAFTRVERASSVWTLDLDDGALTRVSPPGGSYQDPAFSPDCRALAYAGRDGL